MRLRAAAADLTTILILVAGVAALAWALASIVTGEPLL